MKKINDIPKDDNHPRSVLECLRGTRGDVSGEVICQELGISRAAVWKHIQTLRGMGYEIDAAQRRGYRLRGVPNLPIAAEVAPYLRTQWLGRHWVYLDKVTSTNRYAADLAEAGDPDGTVVIAEEQKLGRGRMARRWFSPPDVNLYMSALFRPKVSPQQLPSMSLVAGLAVARAVKKLYPKIAVSVKWPNDLMVDGKKLAGVLCDMRAEVDNVHYLVVGIGINVNMRAVALPPELNGVATSLRELLKRDASRQHLAAEILNQLEDLYRIWLAGGLRPLIPELEKTSLLQGREVAVSLLSGEIRGKVVGIAPSGALILQTMTGARKEILSGDVHVRRY